MTAAVDVRVCARSGCDNPLTKRYHEGIEVFQQRKFCSIPCTRQRLDLGVRRCANPTCSAPLERRPKENSADWRTRRYCRASCYRPQKPPARPALPTRRWCGAPGCGLELKRRHGECGADFRKRSFCGRDCANQAAGKPQPAPVAVPAEIVQLDRGVGACFGRPDAFWTDTGRDEDEVERLRGLAYRFCEGCPIRQGCKAYGREVRFGLYGGELWRDDRGTRVPLDLLAPVESVRAS